ncbi:hypothetical protein C8Q77DRAFT_1042720, partial [Trametes polyzona]
FSSEPGWYAVIRMDPVTMVKHLDDPQALYAAEAMQPKSYLVYLEDELVFPFPNKPWYRYRISVIGQSLRDPDEEKGFTADMCVPIYPNNAHPDGRAPVCPDKTFPYENCYHWIQTDMPIRVRAREGHFDQRDAFELSLPEQHRLNNCWNDDYDRL